MPLRVLLIFLCGLWLVPGKAFGQKNCGTVLYQEILKEKYPQLEHTQQFEEWIKERLYRPPTKLSQEHLLKEVITIPVVVHVIHNGEPISAGSNLDDARILQQIQILNEDFRRLNADTINTPGEFLPVAADVEIEFVLAMRDPEGLPTPGIVRVQGTRSEYGLVHNTELKSQSYWPAEDYLNIWVAQLESLLGYAQFPVSSLEGLEIASENRLTDGVVIDSDFVGINPNSNPESLGRTATHEVGHYLGLRHIWGDGGCGVDDFCDDTPLANSSNFGCPDSNSCGSDDMVENYMDLTDDQCMNLFTICQKSRMRAVLDNSPRRLSLRSSPALSPPVMVTNDAGIKEIGMPQANNCQTEAIPQTIIRNYGTNNVTSVQVALLIDNIIVETLTLNQTLEPLDTGSLVFSNQPVNDMSLVEFRVIQTNGGADNNPQNDQRSLTLSAKSFSNLPIIETFEVFPASWELRNDDNSFTWEVVDAVLEAPNNKAMRVHFFDYDNGDGEFDYLITPALDFSSFSDVTLDFKLSYAQFSSSSRDGLIVAVSTDCGNTYSTANYIFQQEGSDLSTVGFDNDDFVPDSPNDWRSESIDLNNFAGMGQIKIAFIGINDFGNNLYLDDVEIIGTLRPDLDLAVAAINNPDLISCGTEVEPGITLKNTGLNEINSFQVFYATTNGASGTLNVDGVNLTRDQTLEVYFPQTSMPLGEDTFTATISMVNGSSGDGEASNDVLSQPFILDDQRDVLPKIETFEGPLSATDWLQIGTDQSVSWEVDDAPGLIGSGNQGAMLNFFNYSQIGELDYLVSPVLDFSGASDPTLTFDLAYGGGDNVNDGLIILVSTDCGEQYSDTVYSAFGAQLTTAESNGEFFPDGTSDWEKIEVNLSTFAGLTDIRVAFLGVNDFGNNLFVDNIEFFINDLTTSLKLTPEQMILFPNPAKSEFSVAFRLSQRQPLEIRIIDPLGRVVSRFDLGEVLNQTLKVELPNSSGVYILQAIGTSFKETHRIIMTR
ncbi:MAG: choice-of-anchor J domain-containing protein [Cyclobacteriaceae bacterium]|nr:choice-of-anchor J domain-containing protein [Cyclobacteriaceae bacterium]